MLPEEMLELAIGMVQQQTDVLVHLNNDIGFKKYIHDVVFAPVYFCDECEKDFKHKSALERHQLTHDQGRYLVLLYLRLEVQVQGKLDSVMCHSSDIREDNNWFFSEPLLLLNTNSPFQGHQINL